MDMDDNHKNVLLLIQTIQNFDWGTHLVRHRKLYTVLLFYCGLWPARDGRKIKSGEGIKTEGRVVTA
jgi:hypothetical protein